MDRRQRFDRAAWCLSLVCVACGLFVVAEQSSLANPAAGDEGRAAGGRQAIELLADAAAEGLEARDYAIEQARGRASAVATSMLPGEAVLANAPDAALATLVRRYLSDLSQGRVDPRQVGANYGGTRLTDAELDALVRTAMAEQRLPALAAELAPRWPQYAGLKQALARYRALAANPLWNRALPVPAGKVVPGQSYGALADLGQRLFLLGDLAAVPRVTTVYEGSLVEGVKSFQQRHGLSPDGVIGKSTVEQLNVPPSLRARQIELALERLRWSPLPQAKRFLLVNVPSFTLYAFSAEGGRMENRVTMKVIVGKASKTRTPLFDASLRHIEFSPYWNVPPSIARGETLPRLRRDPGYFQRQGFELVGSDGQVFSGLSDESLAAVERGQMRIRQRPGAGNALGDIKFVFPNRDNIYLHHTPSVQLFKRDRRDFSHGCVRVEAPVELAKFVLANEAGWNEARIVQAMRRGRSSTVILSEPLPVLITYSTASFQQGRVHFHPDIYGLDKVLEAALRRRQLLVQASN